MKKMMKKIVCGALTLASVLGCATAFSGCTTSRPEAEIKVSFNGKTYTLEYTLYRKLAPATVSHFIALAEKGYYNGMLVHDYDAEKMYTGGYEYKADDVDGSNELNYFKPYFSTVTSYIPQTVWATQNGDEKPTDPTYTLYGEFAANGFKVQNGALRERFGSLTMFYEAKDDCDATVFCKRSDGKNYYNESEYKYNSATSLFYISISTASASNNNYCTFATLDEDSKSTLESLVDAIEDYISDNFGDEEDDKDQFTDSVTVDVGVGDPFVGEDDLTAEYEVPVSPIVIKSVKITKY